MVRMTAALGRREVLRDRVHSVFGGAGGVRASFLPVGTAEGPLLLRGWPDGNPDGKLVSEALR